MKPPTMLLFSWNRTKLWAQEHALSVGSSISGNETALLTDFSRTATSVTHVTCARRDQSMVSYLKKHANGPTLGPMLMSIYDGAS